MIVNLFDYNFGKYIYIICLGYLEVFSAVISNGESKSNLCNAGGRAGNGYLVGGEQLGIILVYGNYRGVAALPICRCPKLYVIGLIIVNLGFVNALFKNILGEGGYCGAVVDASGNGNSGGKLIKRSHGFRFVKSHGEQASGAFLGIFAVGKHNGGTNGAGCGGGGSVFVPFVLKSAVCGDTDMVIAAVFGALHGYCDVGDAGSRKLCVYHGERIGVNAVFWVEGAGNGLFCGIKLLPCGFFLVAESFFPYGVEVKDFAVLAAVFPIIAFFKRAVYCCAVGVINGVAVGAGCPTLKIVAGAGICAFVEHGINAEESCLVGHCSGNRGFVAVLDIEFDYVLIIAPLCDKSNLVAGENRAFGYFFAERAVGIFDIPAVKSLVCGIIALCEGRQILVNLVRSDSFVVYGRFVAVTVKVNGNALLPMGVHSDAVCRIVCVKFVRNGNFISAFGCVKPALEDIAGANRIGYGAVFNGTALGDDVVVVFAHCAGAVDNLCAGIVRVNGYGNGFSAPYSIKRNGFVCAVGKVFYGFAVLIFCGFGVGCVPAEKIIARFGKGIKRKNNLFIIGGGDVVHAAFAAVAVKGNGVGDRLPLCGIGHIRIYNRFCGKLIFTVKPTRKGITLSGGACGNCASDSGVLRNLNGLVRGFTVVIIEGDGKCSGPHRIEVGVGIHFDCAAVCVDCFAFGRESPTGEYFSFAGKGVCLYIALAAVNALGDGFIRTVVGVEGKSEGRSGGEIAHINAVVTIIAGVVFFVSDGYNITAFCINDEGCPVNFAAGILDKRFGAFCNVHLVVLRFGGNLVFKGERGVAGHGKLKNTA